MNGGKQTKASHTRNITPNFLRFKKKSTSREPKAQEEIDTHNPTEKTQRSGSKASRCSFDVYEKRILHLSKLKNTLTLKSKDNSVEPSKKKKEGLEVTSRRPNSSKREQEQEDTRVVNLGNARKPPLSNSNKNLKLVTNSREKTTRVSNPKRSEQSLQKQQQRAKIQNKQLLNSLMQQQFAPNYINKLKIKKLQQKQKSKTVQRKKFLNCELQLKGDDELKYYQVYEELGKGAYGVVKMGISKRTNQKVAIKIYQKKRLDEPNKIKNLEREINILSKLDHPVIAKLIDAIETSTEIYLIQEYGGANSLYNYLLSKPQHRLPEQEAKQFFRTIAETLLYLHEKHIVHRDIKAENILLNRNKQLKLIDFGFSLESVPPATIDTFCGTPTYMAPEIVSKCDHVPIYTDLWSLGVFMFVILQGNYPFRAKNEAELFQKIRKGTFEYIHKDVSERCRHVIERLLKVNPLERMSTLQMNESFWEWFMGEGKGGYVGEGTVPTNLTTHSN